MSPRRVLLDFLEDRTVPAITLTGVPNWVEQGPGPIQNNPNVVGMEAQGKPVSGAVEAIAAHPTDANTLFVGTASGGIWKTTNALNVSPGPTWTPLTDQLPSLSISSLAFSPLDATKPDALCRDRQLLQRFLQRAEWHRRA